MKTFLKSLAIVVLAATFSPVAPAWAASPDDILGTYLNPDGSRTVRVYKREGLYFGVIATAPAEPDGNEGVGFVVFRDFVFDPEQRAWVSGTLDSPMFPKIEYSGQLSLSPENDLIVRGFVVIPIFGGSSTFPRIGTSAN